MTNNKDSENLQKIIHDKSRQPIHEQPSEAEHEAVMKEMSSYDGCAFEPEVGIFWLDTENGELFDVFAIPVSQLLPNQNTVGKLHKDIWAKKYYRAVAKNDTDSIYLSDYTQIPRGRIFVNRKENTFTVKVGHWIHDYEPMLTPLIKEEFNLTDFTYDIDSHWDLGHGWSEHDFCDEGFSL